MQDCESWLGALGGNSPCPLLDSKLAGGRGLHFSEVWKFWHRGEGFTGIPVEKACGILGSCSPGEQGDHQDGSPGSWFPVLPLSLHGLGFTQHTLWSTGWGLDQPGMLGPGPLGGEAGRRTFGGPAPPTVQAAPAVPTAPTLVTGTSVHLPAARNFSLGRVRCVSVRGREEVGGSLCGARAAAS